jgi:ABC-type glycerol-3-phosphate transport system permease component
MNLTEATRGDWIPSAPQWSNYARAWNDANFSQYFWNSVRIAAITLSGEVIFCVLAAYAFARMEFPGKTLTFSLLLATLMLPEAVTWLPNFITVSWLGR